MSYMTLSSNEKHLSLLCSYFRAHPTTLGLLLKILGGRMNGPSPTSNFGRTVPPVPLGPVSAFGNNLRDYHRQLIDNGRMLRYVYYNTTYLIIEPTNAIGLYIKFKFYGNL